MQTAKKPLSPNIYVHWYYIYNTTVLAILLSTCLANFQMTCINFLSVIIVKLIIKKLNKGFKIPEAGRFLFGAVPSHIHVIWGVAKWLDNWKDNKITVYATELYRYQDMHYFIDCLKSDECLIGPVIIPIWILNTAELIFFWNIYFTYALMVRNLSFFAVFSSLLATGRCHFQQLTSWPK